MPSDVNRASNRWQFHLGRIFELTTISAIAAAVAAHLAIEQWPWSTIRGRALYRDGERVVDRGGGFHAHRLLHLVRQLLAGPRCHSRSPIDAADHDGNGIWGRPG